MQARPTQKERPLLLHEAEEARWAKARRRSGGGGALSRARCFSPSSRNASCISRSRSSLSAPLRCCAISAHARAAWSRVKGERQLGQGACVPGAMTTITYTITIFADELTPAEIEEVRRVIELSTDQLH